MMTLEEWDMIADALSFKISDYETQREPMAAEKELLADVRFTIDRMSKSRAQDGRMCLLREKEFGV